MLTMRDVLAPTWECRNRSPAVEYAARLATILDGSLTVLYNEPAPIVPPQGASNEFLLEIIEIAREETEAARHAQESFAQWAKGLGIRSSTWQQAKGPELVELQQAAQWNDVLVLGRPTPTSVESMGLMGRILLTTDAPCIVVPPELTSPRFDTVAIAWKGTLESVRALRAALPLLARAKRIVLLYGEHGTSAAASEASVHRAEQHLQQHDLKVTLQRIDAEPPTAGNTILTAASQLSADLLVIGAYGRTRFSEWIFGGATRYILECATLPVFMRH